MYIRIYVYVYTYVYTYIRICKYILFIGTFGHVLKDDRPKRSRWTWIVLDRCKIPKKNRGSKRKEVYNDHRDASSH